jgi:hypothetical protein
VKTVSLRLLKPCSRPRQSPLRFSSAKRAPNAHSSRPGNKASLAQDLTQPFDDIIEWRSDFPASPWRL